MYFLGAVDDVVGVGLDALLALLAQVAAPASAAAHRLVLAFKLDVVVPAVGPVGLELVGPVEIAIDLLVAVGDAADDDHVGVVGVLGIAVPVGDVDLLLGVGVAVGVAENLPASLA